MNSYINKLIMDYRYCDCSKLTFAEFVQNKVKDDSNFFKKLFNDETINNDNTNLSESQKEEWREIKQNLYSYVTYDVVFHKVQSDTNKGWKQTYNYCKDYIDTYKDTDGSHFCDTVSIYCNNFCEDVYRTYVN